MCGIVGAVWSDGVEGLSESALGAMTARLTHRGPDDSGGYRHQNAALGFRRLAILDLPGGHQPLSNEDGTIWTVFNGEIYNFPSLRRRLEARGHRLRSAGDTEVLVHLYEDDGPAFVERLRGMFALAIWDAPRRRLVLARDRLGQKPLYYAPGAGRLVFASELKALMASREALPERLIDEHALDCYFMYGYVPHPWSILRGVYKLPPAHRAVWHDGHLELTRYWNPEWDRQEERTAAEDVERLRETLGEAVREQMVSDVPLGAFLSGGIDSTITVGLMQQAASGPVKTFAIGFDDPAFDETHYAAMAAEHLGTEHHRFVVAPEAWKMVPALAEQFDEPFADSSALPTWHVAQQTRAHVTVALTGDAGDELFGGYDRYRALAMGEVFDRLPDQLRWLATGPMARAIPNSSRAKTRGRAVRRLLEGWSRPSGPSRYRGWVQMFDEPTRFDLYSQALLERLARRAQDPEGSDPADVLTRAWDAAPKRDPVTRAMITDLLTYLPGDLLVKVDLASMAHSLECRAPFLDHRVVELALAMPTSRKLGLRPGRSKGVLKAAFADLLPPAIRTRPKMGFGVPLDRWFRGPLGEELSQVLLDRSSLERGLFNESTVRRLIEQHRDGQQDHAYRLWSLLMLELWCARYLSA